jgi:predicted metal-binding membrane protein
MVVMFAAGLTSLWLMAALAAVMLAERVVPRAAVAVTAVALALLLAAALVASGLLPGFSSA